MHGHRDRLTPVCNSLNLPVFIACTFLAYTSSNARHSFYIVVES